MNLVKHASDDSIDGDKMLLLLIADAIEDDCHTRGSFRPSFRDSGRLDTDAVSVKQGISLRNDDPRHPAHL